MSIKLKTAVMKVKRDGQMKDVGMIFGDTAQSIAAIQKTGSDTLAEVTAKGDEVMQSLPPDYTNLVKRVDNIEQKGISAEDVTVDYVPTANGDGSWDWKEQRGRSGDDNRFSMDLDIVDDEFMNSFEINYQDSQDPPRVVIQDHIPNLEYVNNMFKDGRQIIKGEYYSEEETCIGRWIDGKPLYQKCLVFDNVVLDGSGWLKLNYDISSMSISKLIDAIVLNKASVISRMHVQIRADGFIWLYYDDSYWEFNSIVVKYTKTTDTAETPIPQSVLPTSLIRGDNYSTEEQCIGRWVDGKPIYRKIYTLNDMPNGNSLELAELTSLNIETNIKTYGVGIHIDLISPVIFGDYNPNDNGIYSFIAMVSPRSGYQDSTPVIKVRAAQTSGNPFKSFKSIWVAIEYTKITDTASTPISTSLLNSDEIQAMIDTSIGSVLGGEF